jgi:hypothetical protein
MGLLAVSYHPVYFSPSRFGCSEAGKHGFFFI